jgi:hypothetical protein
VEWPRGRARTGKNPDPSWHKAHVEEYGGRYAGDVKAGHKKAAEYWKGALAAEAAAVAAENPGDKTTKSKAQREAELGRMSDKQLASRAKELYHGLIPSTSPIVLKMLILEAEGYMSRKNPGIAPNCPKICALREIEKTGKTAKVSGWTIPAAVAKAFLRFYDGQSDKGKAYLEKLPVPKMMLAAAKNARA